MHRRLNNTVSKLLSKITGRSIAEEARTPTENILMNNERPPVGAGSGMYCAWMGTG